MIRKSVFSLSAVIAALSLALSGCGSGGENFPAVEVDLSQPGPYQTGSTSLTLFDTSRPTPANGKYPENISRTLVTEIRYPSPTGGSDSPLDQSGAPYPLIVFSHGFLAQGRVYSYLTRHLASHGYMTASPDFPLTTITAPGGPNPADVINQPGDVSFVIDRMLAFSDDPDNRFYHSLDPDSIGAAGHSLGSFTTLMASFSPDAGDDRIKAAMPMAALGCPFTEDFFRNRRVPLFLVGGSADIFVTFEQNMAKPFQRAAAPKYLLEIVNGTHMGFTDIDFPEQLAFGTLFDAMQFTPEQSQAMKDLLSSVGDFELCGTIPFMSNPDAVAPPESVIPPSRQRQLVKIYGTAFFEVYLKGKEEYRYFFTDKFVQTTPEAKIQKEY